MNLPTLHILITKENWGGGWAARLLNNEPHIGFVGVGSTPGSAREQVIKMAHEHVQLNGEGAIREYGVK